jgi:hypothetical protein
VASSVGEGTTFTLELPLMKVEDTPDGESTAHDFSANGSVTVARG